MDRRESGVGLESTLIVEDRGRSTESDARERFCADLHSKSSEISDPHVNIRAAWLVPSLPGGMLAELGADHQ